MLHGAQRGCGSLQAYPGSRSHLRKLQAVQDSGGSSLGRPRTRILMSSTLTKPLHFLPLNPQEDFNQPKSKFVKPLLLKLLPGMCLPQLCLWLTPPPPSNLRSNVTSLTSLLKVQLFPQPDALLYISHLPYPPLLFHKALITFSPAWTSVAPHERTGAQTPRVNN